MSEVVDVAEEFAVELWIDDDGYRTVLVERTSVALQTRSEVTNVRRYTLYHRTPTEDNEQRLAVPLDTL